MSRFKKLAFIIIAVAAAISASLVIYSELYWQPEVSPDMVLIVNGEQYKGARGGYGVSRFDGTGWYGHYNPIQPEVANVKRGSEIELKAVDFFQPTEVKIYIYEYPEGNLPAALQFTKLSDYKYLVDIPAGDYQLGVNVVWERWSGGATAYYSFRIMVRS